MENLNEQQRAAVEYDGKHLLVLAGAGTGKTRTIIARAKYLIENGVPPNRILILSFTRKSAKEIVDRISKEIEPGKAKELHGQTFHSWCISLIKKYEKIFPQYDYTLLDEDDQISCIKLLCGKKWHLKGYEGKRISPNDILDVYSYCVNTGCSLTQSIRIVLYNNAAQNLDVSNENKKLREIISMYISYKTERRYIDYDDILLIVSKYLEENEVLRNAISGLYDHVLVDEMQDTNPLQYRLLNSFQDKCHLFCVGDDAQSIYSFRGADFKSIHNFTTIYPDSNVCKLTINYRSTQEILDVANWVLRQSPMAYDKDLLSARGNGSKPQIIHWGDEREEAVDIVNKIKDSVSLYNKKYSDNMAISRTNYGLKALEGEIIKNKIPYIMLGGKGLMQSAHVRDVVSAMRVVFNFLDEIAWMRYLQLWRGIGEVTAAKIISELTTQNNLDDCLCKLIDMNLQKEISETLVAISNLQYNPSKALKEALKVMEGMLSEKYSEQGWHWRKNDFPILEQVAENTSSINEFITEYILDPKLGIRNTIGRFISDGDDAVVLTTIHSAKGLESDTVYVLNVSSEGYPTARVIDRGEESIEEERRCLYVALTRAKNCLYIYRDIHSIHCDTECSKHYFLNEIPEDVYDSQTICDNSMVELANISESLKQKKIDLYSDFDFN